MQILNKMRRQNAVYWPPAGVDNYGRPTFGPLVELTLQGKNYRVRWEDRRDEFINEAGTKDISEALVYVPELPGGGEVATGGVLYLGNRADLVDEANPMKNPGASAVRRFDKLPTLKATKFLRTCYL